jgi:DNA replication and repair protein RecF
VNIEFLRIKNFRNYTSAAVKPSPGKNVFVGMNGQGKSNLLEAIYCLSNTRSFRTARSAEMIEWEKDSFYIGGEVVSRKSRFDIKMFYSAKKKVSPSMITP